MACRVGMTTDPKGRKEYWEKQYPNLKNWVILGYYKSKVVAQAAENVLAQQYECFPGAGSERNENNNWCVYKFDY